MLFDTSSQINSEKFGQLGDYVGGIVGSLWSLAGVVLFYVALTEQREDIKLNRETLETQVKALHLQIKEFELQTVELEETRKELKRSADAQEKSQEALEEQIKTMNATAKLNGLTALFEHYSQIELSKGLGSVGGQLARTHKEKYLTQIEQLLKNLKD